MGWKDLEWKWAEEGEPTHRSCGMGGGGVGVGERKSSPAWGASGPSSPPTPGLDFTQD